jgi:dihydroflavonol-4-reductase
MRILVTGAAGFVGSVLVPMLADRYGAQSLRLFLMPEERLPGGRQWSDIAVWRGDVREPQTLTEAVAGCDVVLHLAGVISYRLRDRAWLFAVNADGAANVAQVCVAARVRRLVHVSSTGAVGFRRDRVLSDESTLYNWPGVFHYMASKRAGQERVRQLAAERGLDVIVLNPAAIMGPGDRDPKSAHNRLYGMVRRSRLMPTFTGGLAVVDVRDVAEAILSSVEARAMAGPCILAGANLRYGRVLRAIAAAFGQRISLLPVPSAAAAGVGLLLEGIGPLLHDLPLTYAYGRMSGWYCYYDGSKALRLLGHPYRRFEQTVADGCTWFSDRFPA